LFTVTHYSATTTTTTTTTTMNDEACLQLSTMSSNTTNTSTFHRDFSLALAQALQENESKQPSSDELAHDVYRQLHYDFPLALSARGCRKLSKLLVNNNEYILSDRFVGGLSHALRQMDQQRSANKPTAEGTTSNKANNDDSAAALAQLGWTLFGTIPAQLLLEKDLDKATKVIGSYRGPPLTDTMVIDEESFELVELPAANAVPMAEPAHQSMLAESTDSPLRSKQLEEPQPPLAFDDEIWAEQSDPSDYDYYESDCNDPLQQLHTEQTVTANQQVWSISTNESLLADSWGDIAQALTNLLAELSYSQLSSLTAVQWRQLDLSNALTLLIVSLLAMDHESDPLCTALTPMAHWHQLTSKPLFFVRDFTYAHLHTDSGRWLLDDYLQLLRTVLTLPTAVVDNTIAVDHHHHHHQHTRTPATWMSIGLLSALCDIVLVDANQHVVVVAQAVIESSDDLCDALERKAKIVLEDDATAIAWSFVSIFQVLRSVTTAHAQILINSGLFRQWLVWYERQSTLAVARVMEDTIFDLCCASPKLLGKYAWRYSGLAATLTTVADLECETPMLERAMLWNLLGMVLAQQETLSGAVKIAWKSQQSSAAAVKAPAPNRAACQQASLYYFQLICDRVVEALSDWKRRREASLPVSKKLIEQRESITCMTNIIDRLSSNAMLSNLFCKELVETTSMIRTFLEPIQNLLSQWPARVSTTNDDEMKVKIDKDNKDENNLDAKASATCKLEEHAVDDSVNVLRRRIKTLQSVLETSELTDADSGGQFAFSSKAD
jgi:hypothetical protein